MADDKTVVIRATLDSSEVEKGAKEVKKSLGETLAANKEAIAAVIAAVVAVVKQIKDCAAALDRMKRDNAFANLKAGADSLARSIGSVLGQLNRQLNLEKELRGVADERADKETQLKLAENEAARETELAGAGSEIERARINARYDANALDIQRQGFRSEEKNLTAERAGNDRRIEEIDEAIGELSKRLGEAASGSFSASQQVGTLTNATGIGWLDRQIAHWLNDGKIKNATDDAERYSQLAQVLRDQIEKLAGEKNGLADRNTVIGRQLENTGLDQRIAEAEERASRTRIATALVEAEKAAKAMAEEPAAKSAREPGETRIGAA